MKYKEVGKKIRDYRQKLDITQQQLADKIGVTWEMVSRYERGKSSPFSRIEAISDALQIQPSQLLQKDNNASTLRYYEVPLFTHIPKDFDFSEKNTSYYYSAPKWIYELGVYVYAIEARLIKNMTLEIRDRGIVYISTQKLHESDDNGIVIANESNQLSFVTSKKDKPIGYVLAQEIRFI